jgi:tetratricopeptide (TPR) repeat protein
VNAFNAWFLRLTLAVSLLMAGAAPAVPQQPNRSAAQPSVIKPGGTQGLAVAHLAAGLELLNRRKSSEAAEQFVEALQADPECAEAHYNLGLLRFEWGDLEEAAGSFREALRIDPLYAFAQLRLANALTQLARTDQEYVDGAILAARRAIALNPGQPEPHFDHGFLAVKKGDFRTAAAEYEKTLALDAQYPEARLNLCISEYQLADFPRAYTLCRAAVAEGPDRAEAHHYLGLVLSKRNEWENAVEELRAAVRLSPESQETHYAFAQALRKTGHADDAAAEFNVVQRLQETSRTNVQADFREYQARKMVAAGDLDRAIEDYRQLFELRRDARTATNWASAMLWKGDTGGAIQALHTALEIDPGYCWAHYYLGVAWARQHEYDHAREALNMAIKSKPDFAEAELYLGLTYAGQQRFQEAETYLRSAVSMRPDAAAAHYYLGLILERLGKQKEGKAEIDISRRLGPGLKVNASGDGREVGGGIPTASALTSSR